MLLTIVIPAYNEARRLPKTLEKIEKYVKKTNYEAEIIVVVEKSEDNTLAIVQEYNRKYENIRFLENDKKYGKGYSVKRGVLNALGDVILFTDSDLSTPIEELDKMLPNLNENDCCIGDRIQVRKQPLHRRIVGICYRKLTKWITGLNYRDTQCGFKLFTNDFGKLIFSQLITKGFAFDVEMLMLAQKYGYKVKPVKVAWYDDRDSKVNVIKDSLQMLNDILRIRRIVVSSVPKELQIYGKC